MLWRGDRDCSHLREIIELYNVTKFMLRSDIKGKVDNISQIIFKLQHVVVVVEK